MLNTKKKCVHKWPRAAVVMLALLWAFVSLLGVAHAYSYVGCDGALQFTTGYDVRAQIEQILSGRWQWSKRSDGPAYAESERAEQYLEAVNAVGYFLATEKRIVFDSSRLESFLRELSEKAPFVDEGGLPILAAHLVGMLSYYDSTKPAYEVDGQGLTIYRDSQPVRRPFVATIQRIMEANLLYPWHSAELVAHGAQGFSSPVWGQRRTALAIRAQVDFQVLPRSPAPAGFRVAYDVVPELANPMSPGPSRHIIRPKQNLYRIEVLGRGGEILENLVLPTMDSVQFLLARPLTKGHDFREETKPTVFTAVLGKTEYLVTTSEIGLTTVWTKPILPEIYPLPRFGNAQKLSQGSIQRNGWKLLSVMQPTVDFDVRAANADRSGLNYAKHARSTMHSPRMIRLVESVDGAVSLVFESVSSATSPGQWKVYRLPSTAVGSGTPAVDR